MPYSPLLLVPPRAPLFWCPKGCSLKPEEVYNCRVSIDKNERYGGEKLIFRFYPRPGEKPTHFLVINHLPFLAEIPVSIPIILHEVGGADTVSAWGCTVVAFIPLNSKADWEVVKNSVGVTSRMAE